MGTRREAREYAVQLLFQLDMNPDAGLDAVFERFWCDKRTDAATRRFAERLVAGVSAHLEPINGVIRQYADNWDLKRIGVLVRSVMRMALYEMLFREDIPHAVSINEAVDLAKYFGNEESGKFVNGILGRARKELGRADPRSPGSGADGERRGGVEARGVRERA